MCFPKQIFSHFRYRYCTHHHFERDCLIALLKCCTVCGKARQLGGFPDGLWRLHLSKLINHCAYPRFTGHLDIKIVLEGAEMLWSDFQAECLQTFLFLPDNCWIALDIKREKMSVGNTSFCKVHKVKKILQGRYLSMECMSITPWSNISHYWIFTNNTKAADYTYNHKYSSTF